MEIDEYLPMSPVEDILSDTDSSGDDDNYLPMKPSEEWVAKYVL